MSHGKVLAQDAGVQGTLVFVDGGGGDDVAPLIPAMRARFPGIRFVRAEAGPESLAVTGSIEPDVVISSHTMPGTDGVAFLSGIRARCPAAFRILVCDTPSAGFAIRATNEGHVDSFLRKPVSGEQLAGMIRKGISVARRGRAASPARAPRVHGDILLVDDDPCIRSVIGRFFGHKLPAVHVFSASDARTGLDILEAHHIDLILADHRLPDMLGSDFLAEAHRRFPEARKVLLTGDPGRGLALQATPDKGVDRLFIKPVDMVAFTRSIGALLPRVS